MRGPVFVIAAVLAVAACGGDDLASPIRSYPLELRVDDSDDRYRYVTTDDVDVRVGDEVTFELDNTGTLIHDVHVVAPDGTTIATGTPVAPGQVATLTVTFEAAGFYRLNCLIDDHLTDHDMQTFIEVTDPGG